MADLDTLTSFNRTIKSMRSALIILAFAAILVPGIAHSIWTDRWEISDEPMASASRLSQLPLSLNDWEGQDLNLDPRVIEKAELAGFLARRYVNRAGDATFSVFLACGRPGPISLHTPEVCYPGAGYQLVNGMKKIELDIPNFTGKVEFLVREYEKPNSVNDRILLFSSWYSKGSWQVPARPRWTFGDERVLHKLYLSQPVQGKKQTAEETGINFLQMLIPELEKTCFRAVDNPNP